MANDFDPATVGAFPVKKKGEAFDPASIGAVAVEQEPMRGPVAQSVLDAARAEIASQNARKPEGVPFDWSGLRGLGQAALDIPRGLASTAMAAVTPPETPGEKAVAALSPGALLVKRMVTDPAKASFQKAGAAATTGDVRDLPAAWFHAVAGLTPVAGPMAEQAFQGAAEGKSAEALSRGMGNALSMAIPEAVASRIAKARGPDITASTQKFTQALRGSVRKNDPRAVTDLQQSIPVLKAIEATKNEPIENLPTALAATREAKASFWTSWRNAMGNTAAARATVDMTPVANALLRTIRDIDRDLHPGAVESVENMAARYRGQRIPVEEAEKILHDLNSETSSLHFRSKFSGEPPLLIQSLDAAADAVRGGLYEQVRRVSGDQGAELMRTYGALSNTERMLVDRTNVAARQAPQNLPQNIANIYFAGKVARGGLKMVTGNVLGGLADIAEGVTDKGVANWLKAQQSTDGLIKAAMRRAPKGELPNIQPTPAPPPLAVWSRASGNAAPPPSQGGPNALPWPLRGGLSQARPVPMPGQVDIPIPQPDFMPVPTLGQMAMVRLRLRSLRPTITGKEPITPEAFHQVQRWNALMEQIEQRFGPAVRRALEQP